MRRAGGRAGPLYMRRLSPIWMIGRVPPIGQAGRAVWPPSRDRRIHPRPPALALPPARPLSLLVPNHPLRYCPGAKLEPSRHRLTQGAYTFTASSTHFPNPRASSAATRASAAMPLSYAYYTRLSVAFTAACVQSGSCYADRASTVSQSSVVSHRLSPPDPPRSASAQCTPK